MSQWNRPVRKTDNRFFIPTHLVLGNFALQTDSDGAIKTTPASSPSQVNPSFIAKPASINLDASGIYLDDAVSTGGRVVLEALLDRLLDTELILAGQGRMALRSLFGSLLTRLGSVEANVADISGVRLASEEAKSALNDIKDAMQDVSGALLQLAVATAESDLAGVLGRVTALEAAPGFDSAPILATIADLSGVAHLGAATAQTAAADVLLAAGAIADLSGNVRGRVDAVEAWNAGSRLDTVESAVASKVAQADYDLVVAALQTSVASKVAQADYDTAIGGINTALSAKAEASDLAAKANAADVDAKGVVTRMETDVISFTGINSAYWGGLIQGIRLSGLAGRLPVVDINDGAGLSFFLGAGDQPAGTLFRVRNAGTYAFTINMGSDAAPSTAVEVVPGETLALVSSGSAWSLV